MAKRRMIVSHPGRSGRRARDLHAVAAPDAPVFASAEVGAVGATTVAVTFDMDVVAASGDYTSGMTVKVNGSAAAISAGVRQANHAIVNYTVPAVVYGDTVTIEYSAIVGHITESTGATPLATFAAQSVTNNVPDAAPTVTAAEVGAVDAQTLVLTFSEAVTKESGNYHDGWSVSVNGSGDTITASSLPDGTHMRLILAVPVIYGDTVTVSYAKSSGHIVDVDLGTALEDVTAQGVTNTVVCILYDTFTGSGAIGSHTPEIAPVGFAWSVKNGTFANLSGGQLGYTTGYYGSVIGDMGVADYEVLCHLTAQTATDPCTGIDIRANSGATNRLSITLNVSDSRIHLEKYTDLTTRAYVKSLEYAPYGTLAAGTEYLLRLYLLGTEIRAGLGEIIIGTFTDSDYTANTYIGPGCFYYSTGSKWSDITVSPLDTTKWAKFSVIGDSITVTPTDMAFTNVVSWLWRKGRNVMNNHGVSGNTIMAHMAGQVTDTLDDGADYVIVQLGTNDSDNAGITAEYQTQLERLKTVYPASHIFCMGILPRTAPTDNGAVNNPRIQTACANAGVTYWDTRTDPWFDPATEGVDGLHPLAAGARHIASHVIALLPA